jgi:hypothetical protein
LGFPLLLGDWDFFLKFGLKDNLGFVGYGLERGGLLLVMDYYGLVVIGFQRFLWGYLLLCWVFFLAFPWVPITMGSKSCGFGKGVG